MAGARRTDLTAVVLFFLVWAITACSFPSWWYTSYRTAGALPTLSWGATNAALKKAYDDLPNKPTGVASRLIKQYTIYGERKEAMRSVMVAEGKYTAECTTVSREIMWSKNQHEWCDFQYEAVSSFAQAESATAAAALKGWCDVRCAEVKSQKKSTCKTIDRVVGSNTGRMGSTIIGGGLAEGEFDREILCGGTAGGAFALLIAVMVFAIFGMLLALVAPSLRSVLILLAGVCFLFLLVTALFYGIRASFFSGSTYNNYNTYNAGITTAAARWGGDKFGFDIGYALLLFVTILSAGLLYYLLKPQPTPVPAPVQMPLIPPTKTEVVYTEPVKREVVVEQPAYVTYEQQPVAYEQYPMQFVQPPFMGTMPMTTFPMA